jgi:toxin ParE1/3/4
MSGAGFALHPEAFADLDAIEAYIAERSPDAADRVVTELYDAIRVLAQSPHMGHHRPDLTSHPLRFWAVRDYLIAYAPDEQPLLVVAVLYGRRNPRLLRSMLGARL